MPNRLVALNVAKPTPEILSAAADSGFFVAALAARGLDAVITTRRSFRDGSVIVPAPQVDRMTYDKAVIDPANIAAVRNHVIPVSRDGYLTGPGVPLVLNSDATKEYATGDRMQETVSRWAAPEGADLRLPAGVVGMSESTAQRLAAAQSPELRAYVVRNGRTATVVPVVKDGDRFIDVGLSDEVNDAAWDIATGIVDRVARDTGERHILGAVSIAETDSGLCVASAHFSAPKMPSTRYAPDAADRLNEAVADALADMADRQ